MATLPALKTTGERLRYARELVPGRQQSVLAKECDVTDQAVSGWERTGKISTDNMVIAARVYGVPFLWLHAGGRGYKVGQEFPDAPRGVPVISQVQAGLWMGTTDPYAQESWETYLVPDKQVSDLAFALRIEGDSMTPKFQPGDFVIVDPAVAPRPGDFIVAAVRGHEEATFKRYWPRDMRKGKPAFVDLIPLNEAWPTLTLSKEQPGDIVGTMVEHRSYRR